MSDADSSQATLRAIAKGRVQGVGYRNFVERNANSMGLTGWVRNLPDGTVELEAGGKRSDLERLVVALRKGPLFAKVTEVVCEWDAEIESVKDFETRY